jgi:hypothetical protein
MASSPILWSLQRLWFMDNTLTSYSPDFLHMEVIYLWLYHAISKYIQAMKRIFQSQVLVNGSEHLGTPANEVKPIMKHPQ